jgi:uncharacterized protein
VLLAVIGLVHGAFFSGDILIIYALLGLLLIPVQKIGTRMLAALALVLLLNIPGLFLGLSRMGAPAATPTVAVPTAAPAIFSPQRQFDIKQWGTAGELVHMNLTDSLKAKWNYQVGTGRLWMTYGLFLLGLCAGRLQVFRDTEANRTFFRRLAIGAGVVAVGTTIIAVVSPPSPAGKDLISILAGFSFSVQQVSLSAVYLALITLMFWRQPTRGLLPQLAPMGKMGLTTYLLQTVFGLTLFYGIGFGMLGHVGTSVAVAAGIAFFLVQILVSRWWMTRFSMGPVEWLWRSLTYFKWQSNAHRAVGAT